MRTLKRIAAMGVTMGLATGVGQAALVTGYIAVSDPTAPSSSPIGYIGSAVNSFGEPLLVSNVNAALLVGYDNASPFSQPFALSIQTLPNADWANYPNLGGIVGAESDGADLTTSGNLTYAVLGGTASLPPLTAATPLANSVTGSANSNQPVETSIWTFTGADRTRLQPTWMNNSGPAPALSVVYISDPNVDSEAFVLTAAPQAVIDNLGGSGGGSGGAVVTLSFSEAAPEPTSATLILLAATPLLLRRRSRTPGGPERDV